MAALVWLLIPVVSCLIATLWAAWASRRSTGVGGAHDNAGVRRHQAFSAAMERPARAAPVRVAPAPAVATPPAATAPVRGEQADGAGPVAPVVMGGRAPAPADG